MSEAEDGRLYGLMEVAEGQQAALEGLAAERAALRREREVLARQVQAVEGGARAVVRAAVTDSLAGAATEGAAAVQAATTLRGVVAWASWRLLGWVVAMGAATVVLGWLMSSGVLWWNTRVIGAAQERRAQLQAEVAEMQASRDGWVKAGMMAKLERCNPRYRPCIRVNESAGAFENQGYNDYRVIQGY